MKKTIRRIMALALCLMMCVSLLPIPAMAADTVTINKSNFPDKNFREYVRYNFDYDGNGVLSQEERENVYEIWVEESCISSLIGIEHFPYLSYLNCWDNYLTTLDVSKNTYLSNLSCGKNELTTLDVSKNTELIELSCEFNILSKINVTKNTKLSKLYCDNNKLTTLDVSNNKELTVLYCGNNALTALDVSKNTKLELLYCAINKLTTLDIKNNPKLKKAVTHGTRRVERHVVDYYYEVNEESHYELTYDDSVNLIYKAAKPKITTQPKNASVKAGKKVTFKVKAVGEGLKYQWYRLKPGTKKWEKIKKATKASYSFKAARKWNGYKFRCVVSNAAGKVTSKSVKLKVK